MPAGKLTLSSVDESTHIRRYANRPNRLRLWAPLHSTTDVPAGQTSVELQLVPARYTATFQATNGTRWRSADFTVPVEGGVVPMIREVN
jgi:hypothetical protein